MSLNEIAVDLTCEAEAFEPASTHTTRLDEEDEDEDEDQGSSESSPIGIKIPGQFIFPSKSKGKDTATDLNEPTSPTQLHRDHNQHFVHGGMLRLARAMGDVGKPVQLAVMEALYHNVDYGTLSVHWSILLILELTFPILDLVLCGHSLGAGHVF